MVQEKATLTQALPLRIFETGPVCQSGERPLSPPVAYTDGRPSAVERVDIADFGDDTGGADLADVGDRGQCIRNDFKLLLNVLVQHLDLAVQRPHSGDGNRHGLVHGIIRRLRQAAETSGRCLNRFGGGLWVSKLPPASLADERCQLIQVTIGQSIRCLKVFHKSKRCGTGVDNVLVLCQTRAFQRQIINKSLFFSGQALNRVESGSG